MTLEDIRDIVSTYVPSMTAGQFETLLNDAHNKLFLRLYAAQDFDSLRPFRKMKGEGTMPLRVSVGLAPIPSDYYAFVSAYMKTPAGNVMVDFLSDGEYDYRTTHKIEYPDMRHPIACIKSNYISVKPIGVRFIVFTYLTSPGKLTYAVKNTYGYAEFDPVSSSENPWNETSTVMLIQLMLESVGVQAQQNEIKEKASKDGADKQ